MKHWNVRSAENFEFKAWHHSTRKFSPKPIKTGWVGILYGLALLPCQRLNLIILSKLMFWDALAIRAGMQCSVYVQWSQAVQWSHILSSLSYWQQVWDVDSSGILIPEHKQEVFFLSSTLLLPHSRKQIELPWWLSGKESSCRWRHEFDPWSRKIPYAAEQLSLCTTTIEPALWSPGTANTEAHMP